MSVTEKYDVLAMGGGTAGTLMAWTMAKEGKRTAVVERTYIGGSCSNVACLPSKNVIHSAKVASLAGRHQEFGIETGPIALDIAGVYARKKTMVDYIVRIHIALRDGGECTLSAGRVFVNVGTHATIPNTPGLREARPMLAKRFCSYSVTKISTYYWTRVSSASTAFLAAT